MAVKFNFASTDNYLTRLTDINDTLQALSKLSFTGSENGLPTGAIRLNSSKWQSWNGSTWSDITLANNISGNAGTVTNGVYTTGNQTIAGIKSFSDSIAVDTISDGAGANGVTVDGVKLKDGGGTFTNDVIINGTSKALKITSDLASSETLFSLQNTNFNTSFTINTAGSAGAYLGDSVSGDVVVRELNNNLLIGTLSAKKLIFSTNNIGRITIDSNGNVGIGGTPSEKLHVSEGNFLVAGTYGTSPALSVSGAGTRMFFYPRKAAFRAGYVSGTQWDDGNIGVYSVAMGTNTTASGDSSTAIGRTISASGDFSTAMGYVTTASGDYSTALGRSSKAVGDYSFAINLSNSTGPDVPANTFRISGATAIGGNVAWTNYSDRREKEDIRLLTSELDKINLLKPSVFKWKTVNEGVAKTDNLGLIAQEVREVYPEVVKGDEETEILSLEYTGLIAPMIKAIQELTSRLEILEKKG